MSRKITCTNESSERVFFDYTFSPFFLESCDGIYYVSNNVKTSDNTNTDGSTYQGSNTQQRNIVIGAQVCEDHQHNRDALYRCFRPKSKGTFLYEEDGESRQIDYHVESIDIEEEGVVRDISISLLCNDPFFMDTSYTVVLMAGWESGFEFDHEFPEDGEELSYRSTELIKDVENDSTADTVGMVITLEALEAVVNPVIRNLTTGEYIKLEIEMELGDVIEIYTETGKKNVYLTKDGVTESINGYLDEGSEFIQLQAGTNTLQYEAESGTDNLDVTVKYRQKYIGV